MGVRRCRSNPLQCWIATLAALIATCSCDGPLPSNPAEVDPILDSNFDQFWAIPLGRAGYPQLNDGPQSGPTQLPGVSQPGFGSPGGASFYPGPIPGSVQVGYFSGPPSYPPGNYGFNGNGVFGFSIPANALVQQQQSNNQQNSWGSGFWSRFNPVNRVGSFFNFSQRQPVHQYAFSASITNQNNNRQPTQNNPQQQTPNNPTVAGTPPLYYSGFPQPSQNWYSGSGNYVPFGNPYFFTQNSQFSNSHNQQQQFQQQLQQQQQQQFQQQNSDLSNNADKNPSYNRPSIPVYNPPSSIPDNSEPLKNGTENPSTFSPTPPLRSGSSDSGRPGLWGENLRRNWLHVPWIGNLGNRDVSPRTDYPGATLFPFQG